MTDIYEHHDWARVEALIKTWPAATRIAPDALAGYMQALIYPNGRDRAARTDDPLALERALLELIQEDTTGKRPPIGAVVERLALHRQETRALHERFDREAEPDGGPPADWVVAHAVALGGPELPLVLASARRHGRPLAPEHDPRACPACYVIQRRRETETALTVHYGSGWNHNGEALDKWAQFEQELEAEFQARVTALLERDRKD